MKGLKVTVSVVWVCELLSGWGENRSATGGLLYLFNGEKSARLNGQICRCRRSEGGCKRPGPQQCVLPEYPTIERTRCACESEAKQGEPRREQSRALIEIPARMGRHGGLDTFGVRSSARLLALSAVRALDLLAFACNIRQLLPAKKKAARDKVRQPFTAPAVWVPSPESIEMGFPGRGATG